MLPRSKILRALLVIVPLCLVALLWNAARQRPKFVATPVPAQALALSHDGKRLAFSIQSTEVLWGEAGTLHKLPSPNAYPGYPPSGSPPAIQFAPGGDAIYRIENDVARVFRWDLNNNRVQWSAISTGKATRPYNDFAVSRDGRRMAQRIFDVVKVFDITGAGAPQKNEPQQTGRQYARTFPLLFRREIGVNARKGDNTYVSDIALSADGSVLILADAGGSLQFWNVALNKLSLQTPPLPYIKGTNMPDVHGEIKNLTASPDGRFVALCDDVGVALWNAKTRQWRRGPVTTPVGVHTLDWMPDSRSLWTSSFPAGSVVSANDKVQQLSVPDLKPLRILPASGPLAVAGDGHTLATRADAGKGVWLWNID